MADHISINLTKEEAGDLLRLLELEEPILKHYDLGAYPVNIERITTRLREKYNAVAEPPKL